LTIILRSLKEDTEQFLGEGQETDAVIMVSTFFYDARRRATRDASKMPGLNVLRVLNEPTAAAFTFGLDLGDNGTAMVSNLGEDNLRNRLKLGS